MNRYLDVDQYLGKELDIWDDVKRITFNSFVEKYFETDHIEMLKIDGHIEYNILYGFVYRFYRIFQDFGDAMNQSTKIEDILENALGIGGFFLFGTTQEWLEYYNKLQNHETFIDLNLLSNSEYWMEKRQLLKTQNYEKEVCYGLKKISIYCIIGIMTRCGYCKSQQVSKNQILFKLESQVIASEEKEEEQILNLDMLLNNYEKNNEQFSTLQSKVAKSEEIPDEWKEIYNQLLEINMDEMAKFRCLANEFNK